MEAQADGSIVLSAIIVNYQSWPDTVCLAHRLHEAAERIPGAVEIVVVDNGSDPHPLAMVLQNLPRVRVVSTGQNLGYAAGVNRGWRASRGKWLLIMNPDLVIPHDFLWQVGRWIGGTSAPTKTVDSPGRVGIVGFRLLNRNGSLQHSTGFFPQLWWTLAGPFFPRARRKYRPGPRRASPVDWVSGACFLAARAVFEQLGGMDENFFLYYEEVDLCWRAWQGGWRVIHDPTIAVWHLHPLERRSVPPALRVITRRSLLYYYRKNLPRWQFIVLAGIVWAQAAVAGLARYLLGPWGKRERMWQGVRRAAVRMLFGG